MPIQGFTGFGGGATGASFRSSDISSKYVDDVFNVNAFIGTGSNKSITNNINLASQGGMVWMKNRDQNYNHWLFTSSMGIGNAMRTNNANDKWGFGSAGMVSFDNDGYTVGTHQGVNKSGDDMVGWTFRNSKAFQQLTYEGTGSAQNIPHSLGSLPGMIIVKNIDTSGTDWSVYHREFISSTGTPGKYILLNSTAAAQTTNVADYWNNTAATATQFTVGTDDNVNKSGDTYIAYLFAGGPSYTPYAAGRSVDFDDDDGLDVGASSDFNFGTGQFCIECWVYLNEAPGTGSPSYARVFQQDGPTGNSSYSNLQVTINPGDGTLHAWAYGGGNPVGIVGSIDLEGGWHHIAVNRDSNNVITQWVDGVPDGTVTTATNFNPNSGSPRPRIGSYDNGGTNGVFNGKISNLRVTVGEPVYTAAFTPSTEPFTTTSQGVTASNVKLLCCNAGASVTGSTVTSGTITSNGDPSAAHATPFDDPAAFAFGEDEDQEIVKCGSYRGNGAATGREVYIGWEPQYVMIKRHDSSENWNIYDSMRGIVSDGNDEELRPESSALEYSYSRLDLTPTGFRPMTNNQYTNQDDGEYIYLAFRMSDGVVGKPAEAGTDVFAIDLAGINAGDPSWISNFPVDFQFIKDRNGTTYDWFSSSRLNQGRYMSLMENSTETSNAVYKHDYSNGWGNYSSSDAENITSWMWKRHAGFDVQSWEGTNSSRVRRHNLGRTPEMIWFKNRDTARNWRVYHKGLNGGTNPEDYAIQLNSNAAEASNTSYMTGTAPTSTHFVAGNDDDTNGSGDSYLAFLFASVSGISSVGYYNGVDGEQTITTGFQPRFVIIKRVSDADHWFVLDTARGWGSGNDEALELDTTDVQASVQAGAPTSTGFTVPALSGNAFAYGINGNGYKFVYYAHA